MGVSNPQLHTDLVQVILSGVVLGHVACKYIYVRLFRGSDKMHSRSFLSIGSWVAICIGVWVVSWVVAESIPVFNDLLSLIVSLEIHCTVPTKTG
jgi:hypothetical protein